MNRRSFRTILIISGLLFSGCGEVNVSSARDTNQTSLDNSNSNSDEEEWDTTKEREFFQMANLQEATSDVENLETENITRENFSYTQTPPREPLYEKCKGCHGANGEKVALGKSDIIGGEGAYTTVYQLKEYRAGRLDQYGMGSLMTGQVSKLSDEEIAILAIYIQNLSGIE